MSTRVVEIVGIVKDDASCCLPVAKQAGGREERDLVGVGGERYG